MIAVSDAGPLLYLAGAGRIELLVAKDRGLVERIRPVIEEMRALGMYVSEALIHEVLASAGEEDVPAR